MDADSQGAPVPAPAAPPSESIVLGFVGDPEATAMLSKPYRAPWVLPA